MGPLTHSSLSACVDTALAWASSRPEEAPLYQTGLLKVVVTATGTGDRSPLTSPPYPCTTGCLVNLCVHSHATHFTGQGCRPQWDPHGCHRPDVKALSGEMVPRRPPVWAEVGGEDAPLPSSEPIPAGEVGADTVWTSSLCESRAPSTLSWQTAAAGSVKLTQGHTAEGKGSLTTESPAALPAETICPGPDQWPPRPHHIPRKFRPLI